MNICSFSEPLRAYEEVDRDATEKPANYKIMVANQ